MTNAQVVPRDTSSVQGVYPRLTCQGLQVSPGIISDTPESRRQEEKMRGSHGPLEICVGPARCHSGPCPWEEPGSLKKALPSDTAMAPLEKEAWFYL